MKLSDTVYNWIKYALCIVIPAINVALMSLGEIFTWGWTGTAVQVIVVAQTFLSAIFSISLASYNNKETE